MRWEKAPQQEQRGSVETAQSSGSPAVATEDTHHEGGTVSERECISVSPRTKVEDIRVEAFPKTDSRVVAAKDRVSRLERALEAMGDSEGPEVDGLRAALEKAREFAKGVPLEKQIKDGEQFLIRAKGHLAELEKERSTVEASITDAGDSKG